MDIFSTSSSGNNSNCQCGSKRYCSYLLLFYLTSVLPERQQKCWGWGECHPAVVNRQNFDCSVCPTEDPTTWIPDDLNFKVTCEEEEGTLSFQLDNLLEVKWLHWASLELAYSTSSQGDFREIITSAAGIQKRTFSDLTHTCLNFKDGIKMKQAICGSCGPATAS